MLPFKRILCPTDFSEPSYQALEVAKELASHFSSHLILMHVVKPVPPIAAEATIPATFNVVEYQRELETSYAKATEDLAKQKVPVTIAVDTIVTVGDPADEIVRVAEEQKADIIVIATHGQTGWRRFVFGSVTEKVVRLSSRPVLTIHEPQEES